MTGSITSDIPNKRSTKIGIVWRMNVPGGVQSVIFSLIKGLNARNIVPDILWDEPPNKSLLESRGLCAGYQPIPFRVSTRVLTRLPLTLRHMLRTLNIVHSDQLAQRYDYYFIFYNGFIVTDGTPHVNYLSGPPLLPQLMSFSPGLAGLPGRTFYWAYDRWLYKRYPAYSYHRAANYVINSQFTADLFEEAHGVKLPVVHPPINLSGRSFQADDLGQRDTITFFSRFARYKRPHMVLQLAQKYPEKRFVLMGGVQTSTRAYYDSLVAYAQQNGLKNVVFLDTPSDERIREELARTRFYVFPAINEHFGMATAEAIGSGAIPYVHDSGGQREIVPDPRLRFKDGDFKERFASILDLSEEELNQARLKLLANVQRFSEEAFLDRMLAFLDQPLERETDHEFQASTA